MPRLVGIGQRFQTPQKVVGVYTEIVGASTVINIAIDDGGEYVRHVGVLKIPVPYADVEWLENGLWMTAEPAEET